MSEAPRQVEVQCPACGITQLVTPRHSPLVSAQLRLAEAVEEKESAAEAYNLADGITGPPDDVRNRFTEARVKYWDAVLAVRAALTATGSRGR